jgi:hypothetical protein
MTNDSMAALLSYFNTVREQIIAIATEKGMSATGKTLASLEVIPTEKGYELHANDSIYFMEHGRGPTHPGATEGNPNLVEIIEDWLEAKGLSLNPYAVANTIHKKGTKLYRAGGNSGVLSIPLNLATLDQVFNEISAYWMAEASSEIYEAINNLNQ